MIDIKNAQQLDTMREGGRRLDAYLQQLVAAAQPGVTTLFLDEMAERLIVEAGDQPNFSLVPGYEFTICASVNEQVIHGFPNKRQLLPGDLLTIDIGLVHEGLNLDHATTILIGDVEDAAKQKFLQIGQRSVDEAIDQVKPGARVGDISFAMQSVVEGAGYSVIREFSGHGIGEELHMDPTIPCLGKPGTGAVLQPGMTLAIEVMMNMGKPDIKILKDGWTVVSRDKSLSAQFEHTVAVTEDGYEVLTLS